MCGKNNLVAVLIALAVQGVVVVMAISGEYRVVEKFVSEIYAKAEQNNYADADFSDDATKIFALGDSLIRYDESLRNSGFSREDDEGGGKAVAIYSKVSMTRQGLQSEVRLIFRLDTIGKIVLVEAKYFVHTL